MRTVRGLGNDLIREGRKRRGLTQAKLAALAGTTQSAISRLESGKTAPSFDDVLRYLHLMDLDLDFMLVERDDADWAQAQRMLQLTPEQRFAEMTALAESLQAFREDGSDGAS